MFRTPACPAGSFRFLSAFAILTLIAEISAWAAPAGAPGVPHSWAPALKQAVGTSFEEARSTRSPVWFTVAEGILTEVFYPTIDQAQVGDLQFLVTDGNRYFSEQRRDTVSRVSYSTDGATVVIEGRDRDGKYDFRQKIVTDVDAPVVRIFTQMRFNRPGLRLHVLFKPALGNDGENSIGNATQDGLFAYTTQPNRKGGRNLKPVHAALLSSLPWSATSVGYVGVSDGWQDLSRNFRMTQFHGAAGPGNIALVGELQVDPDDSDVSFELALGFGTSDSEAETFARTSLSEPFGRIQARYDGGWNRYLNALPHVRDSEMARLSALVIKTHEDKFRRGAIVASLSKPGIPGGSRTSNENIGGYHLVWPRDLYHAAMGLLAAGDRRTPVNVLAYLRRTQREDGSWWQNQWIDGRPYWRATQMDQVAFPILLAWQLEKKGVWRLSPEDLTMVRRAAEFIRAYGPYSAQDRWEEVAGFIPSTIASQIAALRAAARLLGDDGYRVKAEEWIRDLPIWTIVPNGPLGRNYFLRFSSGEATRDEWYEIANGGGRARRQETIDGGFLELVRLGVLSWDHDAILDTLAIYENPRLGVAGDRRGPGGGQAYRRYTRDAYGQDRIGGFWGLLAGERGHYAIEAGDFGRARAQLNMLLSSALPSGMIPEQTVSPDPRDMAASAGAGVACPLVWAHAEALRLKRSLEIREVFDRP